MTLRITPTVPGPPAVLTLDGRLTADEIAELRRRQRGRGAGALDLTGLQFADRQGVCLLLELRAQGAELTGVSPYPRLMLVRR